MARKKTETGAASQVPEKQSEPAQKPVVAYLKPLQDVPTYYADNTAIRSSVFSFRLVFGLLTEPLADDLSGTIPISPQLILNVSPAHAKILAKLLGQQVDKYEKKYGSLPET